MKVFFFMTGLVLRVKKSSRQVKPVIAVTMPAGIFRVTASLYENQ